MVVYDLGNISDWLTSIGTISAVVVALYLSRKDEKPRAKVKASYGYGISFCGETTRLPLYISMQIVNTGKVPIHLSECTIQMSRFSKKRMGFVDGDHNVNKMLNSGEYYEHKLMYDPIKNYLNSKRLKRLKTYMFFKDSLDNVYKAKIVLRS
ncbi:hypothetical protein ABZ756_02195 [Mammaliicoccus sciuri]